MIEPDGSQLYFDFNASTGKFVADFGSTATLVHDTPNGRYVVTYADGSRRVFGDSFTHSLAGPLSQETESVDAGGNRTYVFSWNSAGLPTEIRIANGGVDVESWLYAYLSGGVNDGLVDTITQRQSNGSGWTATRALKYAYYDGSTSAGTAGQIRTAQLKDSVGTVLEDYYYRYYAEGESGGFAGGLKYELGAVAYKRALAANPSASSIDELTDAQLATYADQYLTYDSLQRIVSRTVQGEGCSACTGGQGSYGYSYVTSTNAGGANSWRTKLTETLPDGGQNVTYYNDAGQVMLSVAVDAAGQKWGTFHVYDAQRREVMTASPSAVQLPASLATIEAYADLLHNVSGNYEYVADAAGQVNTTSYYGSTTATATVAGGAAGYLASRSVRQGEGGASAMLDGTTYFLHQDVSGVSKYLIAETTRYRNADGSGAQTTSFAYTFHSGTLQAQTITTTEAVVATGQNGSGTAATSAVALDLFGRTVWSRDSDGFLSYYAYDAVTGGVVKSISDVDTTKTSTFDAATLPSGWSTPTGGGKHLTTYAVIDAQGRTTKSVDASGVVTYTVYNDAAHEVRTYRGWNATTGQATGGPIEVMREDRARGYVERLTMSATPAVSGSAGSYAPTGTEAIGNLQSLSREILNASNQVIYRDAYTTSGLTYSTNVTIGTAGTDYLRTEIGYDWRGRQARVKSPDGTWTHTVYDGLGRVESVWKGTNNSGWQQTNPAGGGTGGNNMVKVSQRTYDNGGVGDSLLTASTAYADATTSYAAVYAYDYRGRMTGQRGPDGVATRYTLDNLGRQTAVETFADADADLMIDAGELRGKSETFYDERGQAYRSTVYEVDPATGASPGTVRDGLSTNYWYDARGNVVKTASANGLFHKTQYDGVGRMVSAYVSFDAAETSWADALTVTGDTVVSQQDVVYVGDRQAITSTLDRTAASGSTTGRLTPAIARLNASVTWYDAAGRVVGTGAYGTDPDARVLNGNGTIKDANSDGIPDAYAAGVPTSNTSSGTLFVILAKTAYDAAGRLLLSTDNAGHVTQYHYDLLGRRTAMIENYVDGVASETENATDRTTEWHYDPWGRLVFLRALNPLGAGQGVQLQDTQYFYGSDVDRSWVTHTVYPDHGTIDLDWDATGKAVLDYGDDLVIDAYDRLGRKTTSTDQRGVVHTYNYDAAGRLGSDVVTSLGRSGENVDGAVRAIGHTYDDVGRRQTVTSYANTAMTSVANQVKLTYDGWGNVIQSQQAHGGAVTGTTPAVNYTFDDGATSGVAKYLRLSKVTYPNGRELFYLYGGSDAANGKLNRVYEIGGDSNDTNSTYDARFFYAGTGTLVRETRANGTSKLDYDPSANGSLSGLDRFGRVVDQTWSRYTGSAWAATDATQYAYDANSNRTSRISSTNGAGIGDPNAYRQSYTYDGLDRLTGSVDAKPVSGAWTNQNGQSWNGLDALGNWRTSGTDTNGDGVDDVTQTRSHNAANEITSVAGSNWTDPTYDAAGNMTRLPPASGSTDAYQKASYDAWNRQVGVVGYTSGNVATTTTVNKFDGLGRRTSGNAGEAYFDESWRELELRSASTGSTTEQNVWDPRYVDALISRDVVGGTATAATTAGTLDTTFDSDGKVTLNIDATDYGRRVAIQSDGKILVAGRTGANGSTMDFAVVRYNTDGSLDSTWGTSGIARTPIGSNDEAFSLALLSSGKVMVVGSSDGTIGLVRYNSNGMLDTSFDGDGKKQVSLGTTSYARNIVVDANGKLVIAGQYGSNGSSSQGFVIRINADGTADSSWNSGSGAVLLGSQNVRGFYGLTLDANGKIVVSGQGSVSNDHFNFAVARLNTNGTLDTTFNSTGVNVIQLNVGGGDGSYDVAVQSDGKIVAAGYSGTSFSPYTNGFAMVRLTTSGSLDSTFGSGGKVYNSTFTTGSSDSAYGLSIQSDGTIVLAGSSAGDFALARYTSAGSLDASFGMAGTGRVKTDFGGADGSYAVARDAAGRFVLAGFTDADMALARYHGVTQAATSGTQRQWVQQDANFNVTSVAGDDGAVLERYRYTPYGERTVLNAAGTAAVAGNASAIGNPFGHQGGRFDAASGLMHFRRREYAAALGRWPQRDAAGYIDGYNLTQYLRGNPLRYRDSMGSDSQEDEIDVLDDNPQGVTIINRETHIANLKAEISGALKNAIDMERAFGAVVGTKLKCCPEALNEQADAIAESVATAIADQGIQVGGWLGNLQKGVGSILVGPDNYNRALVCGEWKKLVADAIGAAFGKMRIDGKQPCFVAEGQGYENLLGVVSHHWVAIAPALDSGVGSVFTVIIDPWPSGGVHAVDTSSVGEVQREHTYPIGRGY